MKVYANMAKSVLVVAKQRAPGVGVVVSESTFTRSWVLRPRCLRHSRGCGLSLECRHRRGSQWDSEAGRQRRWAGQCGIGTRFVQSQYPTWGRSAAWRGSSTPAEGAPPAWRWRKDETRAPRSWPVPAGSTRSPLCSWPIRRRYQGAMRSHLSCFVRHHPGLCSCCCHGWTLLLMMCRNGCDLYKGLGASGEFDESETRRQLKCDADCQVSRLI